MELAGMWIALFGAAAGIASAVFAFVQAKEATDSRRDAQAAEAAAVAARDAAVLAQQESASAAGRIAQVLEEQAAAAAASAAKRDDPWEMRPGRTRRNGDAMLVVQAAQNLSVADVSLEFERRPSILHIDPNPVPPTMRPGDAFELYWMGTMGDPGTYVLNIHWRWEDQETMNVTRATFS